MAEPTAAELKEASAIVEKKTREICNEQLAARNKMVASERKRLEDTAGQLREFCSCNHCKQLLLEPWTVKDCGHLYCYKCLQNMIYDQKGGAYCKACGPGGDRWNAESFGAFKVVVDAEGQRRVAREGAKFLYDDAADTLLRIFWPDRVEDYVNADVDRAQRRLHDEAARHHYEVGIQGDRLVNPSSANPGMAGTRGRERALAAGANRRRPTRISTPPTKIELPTVPPGVSPAEIRAANPRMRRHLFCLLPVQCSAHDGMKAWAQSAGLMRNLLPPLLKPYVRVATEMLTVGALKEMLAAELQTAQLWHDTSRHYPAAEKLQVSELVLIPDWTQHDPDGRTPEGIRLQPLPDDEEVAAALRDNGQSGCGAFSLQALLLYLRHNFVEVEPSLDLMYAVRVPPSGNVNGVKVIGDGSDAMNTGD